MYRIHQIKISLTETKDIIPNKIKSKLEIETLTITNWAITKESIDARNKGDIKLVYTVDFESDEVIDIEKQKSKAVQISLVSKENMGFAGLDSIYSEFEFLTKEENTKSIAENLEMAKKDPPPVVIGFGPCGMFAALALAEMGLKPIVFERGKAIEERVRDVNEFWTKGKLDPESNVQFGEGGAGTFSDGKLTTGIKDPRIKKVLWELKQAGGAEEILYKQKPHIGTDVLIDVVRNIREKIISLGGQVNFQAKVTNVLLEDLAVKAVEINGESIVTAKNIVYATGQGGTDSYEMLYNIKADLEQKPFSMGIRIEHEQKLIDKSQYGNSELAKALGAAEYKLSHKAENGRGVYTFCMCPGGQVILATNQEGQIVTNGMSNKNRDSGKANSGILVDVRTKDFENDHPLAGLAYRAKYEKKAFEENDGEYSLLETTWENFKKSDHDKVAASLPPHTVDAIREGMQNFGKKIRGFDAPNSKIFGVETRSSSPVRILRNDNLESNIQGIFPGGEGAGTAGGITSAAVDGLKLAEAVVKKIVNWTA